MVLGSHILGSHVLGLLCPWAVATSVAQLYVRILRVGKGGEFSVSRTCLKLGVLQVLSCLFCTPHFLDLAEVKDAHGASLRAMALASCLLYFSYFLWLLDVPLGGLPGPSSWSLEK